MKCPDDEANLEEEDAVLLEFRRDAFPVVWL